MHHNLGIASVGLFTVLVKKHATHDIVATAGIWTLDAIPDLLVSISLAEVQCIRP
jgi:hypothetical protein